jgi:hypothetical protein
MHKTLWHFFHAIPIVSNCDRTRICILYRDTLFVCVCVYIYIYIYIYILTAIGLTPGGSSTVHIYTQTVHRIQRTEHTST